MRGPHDLGGLEAGPVDTSEHDHAPWEKRTDALVRLLSGPERKLVRVDELRRGIEEMGADAYENLSYYERWITSLTRNLTAKGVFTTDELGRKMETVDARWKAARDGGGS